MYYNFKKMFPEPSTPTHQATYSNAPPSIKQEREQALIAARLAAQGDPRRRILFSENKKDPDAMDTTEDG